MVGSILNALQIAAHYVVVALVVIHYRLILTTPLYFLRLLITHLKMTTIVDWAVRYFDQLFPTRS